MSRISSALVYSTYLGGDGTEPVGDIAVDGAGAAYLAGHTGSANFPTKNPYQAALRGSRDAFVTKLNPNDGTTPVTLAYSTLLGGGADEEAQDVALDASGGAYLAGHTGSSDFPTKDPYQSVNRGGDDAFVTKLEPNDGATPVTLAYSTYLGGSLADFTRLGWNFSSGGIAVDGSGSAYVAGLTLSTDFPTKGALQSASGGVADAFMAKLSPGADLSLALVAAPDPVVVGEVLTYTVTVRNLGPETAGGTVSDALPAGVAFVSAPGCSQAAGVVSCPVGPLASGASAQRQIAVCPTLPNPALTNTATVQSGGGDPQSSNDSASVTSVVQAASGGGGPGGGGGPAGGGSSGGGPAGGGGGGPAGGAGGGGSASASASALRAQAGRLRGLRRCLSRARRHTDRDRRRARRGSILTRARRRAHTRRHARSLRRRCRARYGRTPGRVLGLRARALSRTKIKLSFIAPGTHGRRPPPAHTYLIKQSTRPIRGARGFRRARSLCRGRCRLRVGRVGRRVSLTVTGLRPRTTYRYSLAARDNVSRRLGRRSRTAKARTR